MGKCTYCGKTAGLLKKSHPDCEDQFQKGAKEMLDLCAATALGESERDELLPALTEIADRSYANRETIREIMIRGWERAIFDVLQDDLTSEEEIALLQEYVFEFGITYAEQERNHALTTLIKAQALRNLLEGKPRRWRDESRNPFRVAHDETMLWVFESSVFVEQRYRVEKPGDVRLIRVQEGLGHYTGTSAFTDARIERKNVEHVESGVLGVSTRNLYFTGDKSSFQLPFDQVSSVTPYADGIGVFKDQVTANPQNFMTGDGWFTFNLVSNVKELGEALEGME